MPDLMLYHAYTACTRVTLTALEQVGAPYVDHMLDMGRGEHRSPDYLALNPQGKVPALLVDGVLLTENLAILSWLSETFPEAGLLPRPADSLARAGVLSDLAWVSSSWHPSVRALKAPFMWTTGDIAPVKEKGGQLLTGLIGLLVRRLDGQDWWYGAQWSIVDTYLWWACINAEIGGFDLSPFTGITGWRARNENHPALVRALAREKAALSALKERQGQA
jgi:glutathione S-transferase